MKTIQHFKKLYDIAKDNGLMAALKYDAIETTKRHPELVMSASSLYSSIFDSPKVMPNDPGNDPGFAELTIDSKTGEYIRLVRREANDDTTVVSEMRPDGSGETHSYTPIKQADGTWKEKVDLPRVYQLRPK